MASAGARCARRFRSLLLACVPRGKEDGLVIVEGKLCSVERISARSPDGCCGHLLVLSRCAVVDALWTLRDAPLRVGHLRHRRRSETLQREIGWITRAWIDGDDLMLRGVIVHDVALAGVGLSWHISSVHVEDMRAAVWRVMQFAGFEHVAVVKQPAFPDSWIRRVESRDDIGI